MKETTNLLLRLCCSAIKQTPIPDLGQPEEAALERVYQLAQHHSLTPLAAEGLRLAGAMPAGALGQKFRRQKIAAVYADERKQQTLALIGGCLAQVGIPYLPLKGSKLREYYPEPWMRTRCDIDVLVHREDLEQACQALAAAGFQVGRKGDHDVPIDAPGGVHLELHYQLSMYSNRFPSELVWGHAHPIGDQPCCYELDDAMFYFYHIYHMSKHIYGGGCGLRPFFDLWLLNRLENADPSGRDALLRQGGLCTFSQKASELAACWFEGCPSANTVCQKLEDYIVSGGSFGTEATAAANWKKEPNQILLYKFFLPYDRMLLLYPSLARKPWLYPMYHFVRWRDIYRRTGFRSKLATWNRQRISYYKNSDPTKALMDELGLHRD